MLGKIGVDIGEAITIGAVYAGVMITISVRVGLACKVIAGTDPTGFWVGELDLLGRLQAERTAINERDIDRSLNVFNFAFMIA